jgi:ribosomal protein L37E
MGKERSQMKQEVKMVLELTSDKYDSDNVRFMQGGTQVGFGYRAKNKEDAKICLIRCPKCGKENYAMAVTTGSCAWCGFNPNP